MTPERKLTEDILDAIEDKLMDPVRGYHSPERARLIDSNLRRELETRILQEIEKWQKITISSPNK